MVSALLLSWNTPVQLPPLRHDLQQLSPSSSLPHANIHAGVITCQVDAALFTSTGMASYGAVLLSANGAYMGAKAGPVRCLGDPHTPEAFVVREALCLMKSEGF